MCEALRGEYPLMFTSSVGTAKCATYEIELSDTTPVRSPPYRFARPKLDVFKKIVNEILEQGVVRPSKSQYASPAFLVPKNSGEYRLVVDYRRINSKNVFNSYTLPTIDQAFEQFAGAVVFSVLELNSAYFQIPLTPAAVALLPFVPLLVCLSLINYPWG